MSKCKRARKLLIKEMNGSFKVEYVAILAYATEIERSNSTSVYRVELNQDKLRKGKHVFERMFICLDACKMG